MKLQILIPHYHETAEEIRPLLDSIALQQNVDFNEVGVIICHDGDEPKQLPREENEDWSIWEKRNERNIGGETESQEFYFFSPFEYYGGDEHFYGDQKDYPWTIARDYPFEIKQIRQPHKGVSAARNACLDAATAEYVMFCDADDMFCNVCGLYILFNEMKQGFDSMISLFLEESRHPETKEPIYINHEMDSTFVHGKVHRRQYLINKKIRWNEKLTIHEDSFFNILCQNLSQNVKYCQVPFYLWKWRDGSVCRHDPKYILKTYNNMLDSNDALIGEFLSRGMMDKAMFYVVMMIFDAYYTMNKPDWINQENQEYRDKTELRFKAYFLKHEDMWNTMPIKDKMYISNQIRSRSINEGMQMEAVTVDGWLKHIRSLKGD